MPHLVEEHATDSTGKQCETQLTLKTYQSKNASVWCKSHVPIDVPEQVIYVTMKGALSKIPVLKNGPLTLFSCSPPGHGRPHHL